MRSRQPVPLHLRRARLAAVTAMTLALTVAAAAVGCSAASVARKRWVQAEAPGVIVRSTASEEQTAALVDELQAFRALFTAVSGVAVEPSTLPLAVASTKRRS